MTGQALRPGVTCKQGPVRVATRIVQQFWAGCIGSAQLDKQCLVGLSVQDIGALGFRFLSCQDIVSHSSFSRFYALDPAGDEAAVLAVDAGALHATHHAQPHLQQCVVIMVRKQGLPELDGQNMW